MIKAYKGESESKAWGDITNNMIMQKKTIVFIFTGFDFSALHVDEVVVK